MKVLAAVDFFTAEVWTRGGFTTVRFKTPAAYINTDSNQRGFLSVGGSHTLEKFVNEIARQIVDPETKLTVAERWRAHRLAKASLEERHDIRARADVRIEALGSGSDYTCGWQKIRRESK